MLKKLLLEEEAQGMVEYILIIAIVAVLGIALLKAFGGKLQGWFKKTEEELEKGF